MVEFEICVSPFEGVQLPGQPLVLEHEVFLARQVVSAEQPVLKGLFLSPQPGDQRLEVAVLAGQFVDPEGVPVIDFHGRHRSRP